MEGGPNRLKDDICEYMCNFLGNVAQRFKG